MPVEKMVAYNGYSGTLAGSFGVFAGTAALFMFGEVPRVRRDILQQFPFLDTYFDRPIAPEDNVRPDIDIFPFLNPY